MNYANLLYDIIKYVTSLFERSIKVDLTYHNLHHTSEVARHAKEIMDFYNPDEKQAFIISAAAWFHDTGHLFGDPEAHEQRSVFIMRQYCMNHGIDEEHIQLIEGCILATKFPYQPKSLAEEIVCDADSYHLGTKDFWITDKLMKHEVESKLNQGIEDWDIKTLLLLEKHHFFTAYCNAKLNEGKQNNIEGLRIKINTGHLNRLN